METKTKNLGAGGQLIVSQFMEEASEMMKTGTQDS
jgi:hypothetical protein